jgi:deoxyribodipyrimidine photo-lyase
MHPLRREFDDREDLERYLRETFDEPSFPDTGLAPMRGGRRAADRALAAIEPQRYRETRNHLDGAVTRLSPYIRHGIVSLAEARDVALRRVARPADAAKFVSELGWRDYWRRVYAELGERVWQDRELWKTGYGPADYSDTLPPEVPAARSGLACMDAFARELRQTGYLHNHARMWVAAWIVHWLRVRWQAGARWFLAHLLDGDPASNNLSWQWVASTFSHKPYFFNRENLERYTDARYCSGCAAREACPFDGSYAALERRLFPNLPEGSLTRR